MAFLSSLGNFFSGPNQGGLGFSGMFDQFFNNPSMAQGGNTLGLSQIPGSPQAPTPFTDVMKNLPAGLLSNPQQPNTMAVTKGLQQGPLPGLGAPGFEPPKGFLEQLSEGVQSEKFDKLISAAKEKEKDEKTPQAPKLLSPTPVQNKQVQVRSVPSQRGERKKRTGLRGFL